MIDGLLCFPKGNVFVLFLMAIHGAKVSASAPILIFTSLKNLTYGTFRQ
jgi:hypothetical protein